MKKKWFIASICLAIGLVSVSAWSAVPDQLTYSSACIIATGSGIQPLFINNEVNTDNTLGTVKHDRAPLVLAHGGGGGGGGGAGAGAGAGGCGGDAGAGGASCGGDGAGASGDNGGESCGASSGNGGAHGSQGANQGPMGDVESM